MKKLSAVTFALALCASSTAGAANYTFSTKGGESVTVGTTAPNDGRPIQGAMQKGTSVITTADGAQLNETWTCISTTQPPSAKIFDVHSLCDASNEKGSYTITFGCQMMDKNGALGCLGGLYGKTGAYKGKGGGATWMGVNGTGTGTAQWTD